MRRIGKWKKEYLPIFVPADHSGNTRDRTANDLAISGGEDTALNVAMMRGAYAWRKERIPSERRGAGLRNRNTIAVMAGNRYR
jgi:hypothetical protein